MKGGNGQRNVKQTFFPSQIHPGKLRRGCVDNFFGSLQKVVE